MMWSANFIRALARVLSDTHDNMRSQIERISPLMKFRRRRVEAKPTLIISPPTTALTHAWIDRCHSYMYICNLTYLITAQNPTVIMNTDIILTSRDPNLMRPVNPTNWSMRVVSSDRTDL